MPVNYQLGKIYKIWSLQTDKIYIGSTCQPLSGRMSAHRRDYRKYQNGKYPFVTSFEILKHGDAKIELVELVNATCRAEILAREGHYIRTLDCVNKRIPDRDKKEYMKEYMKEYEKKPERKAYKGQKVTCYCGCSITRGNLSAHKKTKKHQRLLQQN